MLPAPGIWGSQLSMSRRTPQITSGSLATSSEAKARERLLSLQRRWTDERRAAEREAAALRREVPLPERIARGVALRDLSMRDLDAAPGDRVLVWVATGKPREFERFRGGVGDPVRLWRQDPDEPARVYGVITRRTSDALAIMVDSEQSEELEDPGFRLDLEPATATFDRGDRVLRTLLSSGQVAGQSSGHAAASDRTKAWRPLRAALLGAEAPIVRAAPLDAWFDAGLDETQRQAVERAVASPHLALIHGPPGTGKTRTLVEVVRQLVARGERVLATAASNAAVDNLAARLIACGVRVVRMGHPARVDPAVEAHTLDALSEASPDVKVARDWIAEAKRERRKVLGQTFRGPGSRRERRERLREASQLMREARQYLLRVQQALIDRAQVVCATAAGADAWMLRDMEFDAVALDEATQSPDPISLVALARAPRAILAGDPLQLPPTVLAEADSGVPAPDSLRRTQFERVADAHPDVPALLRVQYRMHASIMAYPSASMYADQLLCAPEVADHDLAGLGVPDDDLRPGVLLFVDTAGKGWEEERAPDDPSTRNPAVAQRVVAELRRLIGRGVKPTDIALITPYHAQVVLYREWLGPEVVAGLEVGSVDGFQGREKEAIILDLVRSNDAGELGFLRDVRRMNVALTRARRFLLVVGDSATLGEHAYYSAFLQAVEEAGTYLSAWTDDAPAWDL